MDIHSRTGRAAVVLSLMGLVVVPAPSGSANENVNQNVPTNRTRTGNVPDIPRLPNGNIDTAALRSSGTVTEERRGAGTVYTWSSRDRRVPALTSASGCWKRSAYRYYSIAGMDQYVFGYAITWCSSSTTITRGATISDKWAEANWGWQFAGWPSETTSIKYNQARAVLMANFNSGGGGGVSDCLMEVGKVGGAFNQYASCQI